MLLIDQNMQKHCDRVKRTNGRLVYRWLDCQTAVEISSTYNSGRVSNNYKYVGTSSNDSKCVTAVMWCLVSAKLSSTTTFRNVHCTGKHIK